MRIRFEGDCTVARAEELRDELLAALDQGGRLELDFSAVTRIDLSFCQLVLALGKSPAAQRAGLLLEQNLSPGLADVARRCGLPEIVPAGEAQP